MKAGMFELREEKRVKKLMLWTAAIALLVPSGSCTSKQLPSDVAPVYRAARALEASLQIGVNYNRFTEKVDQLATEVDIYEQQVAHVGGSAEFAKDFRELLTLYSDSAKVWGNDIERGSANENVRKIAIANGVTLIPGAYTHESFPFDELRQKLWAKAADKQERLSKAVWARAR
jgi:hypothetical protein